MKPRERVLGWAVVAVLMAVVGAGCGGYTAVGDALSSSGDIGGTDITNFASSPKDLSVGDVMLVDLSDGSDATLDFAGVADGSRFILALGAANATGAGTSVQTSADLALPPPDGLAKGMEIESEVAPENDGYGPQEIMSAWLRASESVLQETEGLAEPQAGAFKAMSLKAQGLGEREVFRVLSSLTDVNSYAEVTGIVRCVGNEVIFYVDSTVGSEILSESDVQQLCEDFDREAAEEQQLLGATSDVDADDKVHVLMTPQINRLGALGGGIITGYFYAGDLYPRSSSNQASNHSEIIYTMVPDPDGAFGYAIDRMFAMSNLLPAVLPHELQHAISYNQHVFVQGGSSEDNWLNEAISHLAEDLMGHNRENPSRYALFLASPSTSGFLTLASPNLMERGAGYLFLRYLYEQASDGEAFLRALSQSPLRGIENLEAAFAGPEDMDEFREFVSRWVIAMAMTGRGISQDSRFTYDARTKHGVTGEWQGVLMNGDAEDGRGTQLAGVNLNAFNGHHVASIDGSTAKYFDVSTIPASVTVSGQSGGGNFVALIRSE